MSKGTDRRTVRVAPELWEAAQTTAAERDDTVSDVIRQALEAYTMTKPTNIDHEVDIA